MIFLRVDSDQNPDKDSYNYGYWRGEWYSAFSSKEKAIAAFGNEKTRQEGDRLYTPQEIESMLVLTDRGWSFPLLNGAVYGYSVNETSEDYARWYFGYYIREFDYLQGWEGTPADREVVHAVRGGDVFIPKTLLGTVSCDVFENDREGFYLWTEDVANGGWYKPTMKDLNRLRLLQGQSASLKSYLVAASQGFNDLLAQVDNNKYYRINQGLWSIVQERGIDKKWGGIMNEYFYTFLDISKEDKHGLMYDDYDTKIKYDNFDTILNVKFYNKYMTIVDYKWGKVAIVKRIKYES